MEKFERSNLISKLAHLWRIAGDAYGPYKRQILLLTFLSFFGGLVEGIGINAVIPLLTLVLGIHGEATDLVSNAIRSLFSLLHIPFFPRYLLAFVVILFLFKAAVSLCISWVQIKMTTSYDIAI